MSPQTPCIRGCIITQIAFVWLFPAVRFQMYSENTWIFGWKFTLVALVWHRVMVILCRVISSINIVFSQLKTLTVFIHNFYWRDGYLWPDLTTFAWAGLLSFDWNWWWWKTQVFTQKKSKSVLFLFIICCATKKEKEMNNTSCARDLIPETLGLPVHNKDTLSTLRIYI